MSSNLDIQATEDRIHSVLSRSEYRFKIPEYQRQYAWEEPQWEDLWNDLLDVAESGGSHFLGSVVVIKRETKLNQLDVLQIVDGQQRLVTISILLCLIRERFKQADEDDWDLDADPKKRVERIDDKYLYKEDEMMEVHPNITLSNFDNDEYQDILNGKLPDKEGKIVESAKYFSEKINDLELEEIEELRTHLVNSMTIVTIECNSEESAFKLFETLNDRGKDLTAVDLMKNHLFSVASQTSSSLDYEQIKTDWEETVRNIKPDLKKPARFFRHYMMSAEEPAISEAVSSYMLYDKFCELIDNDIHEGGVSIQDYISDINKASPLYVDIVNADTDEFSGRANRTINRYLENLNTLGATQERTLLLRLFKEMESANEIIRGLSLIESFIFRWRVTNQTTGTDVDEIHANLCSTIFDYDDPISELKEKLEAKSPSDSEVRVAIRTNDFPRNGRTRYILSKLEMESYTTDKSKVIDPATVEIEHIAPRKAFGADKYSSWVEYLDCGKESFNEYCNQIGNLTLLNERMNARAQNDPFAQKKREYESSEFEMTKDVASQYDNWSTENIEKRTKILANKAPHIWDFDV
ncbi:DUF262 domain-containing protein [Halobacterium salinarum]|uniref:DUF262 domain-containing protein n=1 Tax=Halobacterium salinarum TaxID=2242 RepID=UPI002556055A|nr:DUF262 domain-containing HNH endonuclease family protein [Halobacterium salinarum]MDL0144529.1 DUF262 domain-containing HNH endonuclease family protein [Halobacterium salinarum]